MVKACRHTSVFPVKCSKWKFLGLQYACNLRINLCYANSSHVQFVLERRERVYSNINEVLLHYYFLLQCILKCHINITPHSLDTQAYFFPKIFHPEYSYSNNHLLILRGIFDRIFSKTGNYAVLKCFEVLLYCFYKNLSIIFSISQNKLFECNVCFFIAFYIAFFWSKKSCWETNLDSPQ